MIVIKVENLGKKYIIGHQQKESYLTLRDTISSTVKKIWDKTTRSSLMREEVWALKDIFFEVKQDDRIGIIGRNGAGKTTLLKILSRITEPTTGRVRIKGRVASLLEVGTGFHPELTGRENIYLNSAILGMTRNEIKKKFDEIVNFSGIEKFLDTPVKRYSSGMYVRLAFSIAAHLEPEILLVDEVLAVGDIQFQKKCLGKMEEVGREGRTVLFVSHNMGAVQQLCNKGFLLNEGRIEFIGNIREVINRYMMNTETNASINLLKLSHKGPNKYTFLKHLSIYNESMELCNTFLMGQTIIARIEVSCKKEMKNAEVGLKISSIAGVAIHYFTSSWEGLKINLEEGEHIFEVRIPNIMLFPGQYLITTWICRDGEWSDDRVDDITMIEIISNDITGNFSKLNIVNTFDRYARSGCEVYAPSKWTKIENGEKLNANNTCLNFSSRGR